VSKPKEREPEAPKPKQHLSKPTVKIPGLALSKDPPSATSSNGIKLAIGKPTSPVKEKKPEKQVSPLSRYVLTAILSH
jgi:hypothetical protein